MNEQIPAVASTAIELDAALLQAAITLGLALLCAFFYIRRRKTFFGWWALAWLLYLTRLGAITTFLVTTNRVWLYWHQVITGWTALSILWAALVFSRRLTWRWRYAWILLFPLMWSYFAIYRLNNFFLAAGPAVLFLSLVTLWTAVVFFNYWRRTHSAGGLHLAVALLLWGVHHLDYPFLRARGAWAPWGYYLDILFTLATGSGIVVLVLDDLHAARTSELQRLQVRMIQQHEEERRRVSLELHDETAQVFAAVKLQLGFLRERTDASVAPEIDRLEKLVDAGIKGIRSVTADLRPSLLDDLGLLPALRSLAAEFGERSGIALTLSAPEDLPPMVQGAELALFRALQEALSNVARHSGAQRVHVDIARLDGGVAMIVTDNGRGFGGAVDTERLESTGHLGLAGMRERLIMVGGTADLGEVEKDTGARLSIWVPANGGAKA